MNEKKQQEQSIVEFQKQRANYKKSLREDVELLELECKFMRFSMEKHYLSEKFNQLFSQPDVSEERKEEVIEVQKPHIIIP
jgi:hypothetical protein